MDYIDYYKILGINKNATAEEIYAFLKQRRKQEKAHHTAGSS